MAKYHLITYHLDFGEDDKDDLDTMKEVEKMANNYLNDGWAKVRVFQNHKLLKVFDKNNPKGRYPFLHELNRRL